MSRLIVVATAAVVLVALATVSEARRSFIDLSYAFNNKTILFPGRKSTFNVEVEAFTAGGFWVASKGFCTSEHTSTHIDAPYHFNKYGRTLDQIPLEDLIDIPGVMIDVYDKVHQVKDGKLNVIENYAVTREDLIEWEKANGQIPTRAVVLIRSGWGSRWPNKKLYLGSSDDYEVPAKPKTEESSTLNLEDTNLNYPGFDASAASFLVTERNVLGVGVDTLSIDIGKTKLFPAHVIFAARNVYMLENVANLHLLPPNGFSLWMLPFKIDQGTGAPIRVVASLTDKTSSSN